MAETSGVAAPTPLEVLRAARRIVEDGGDAKPCELGPYCLRCCIAIAKTDLDAQRGTGVRYADLDYLDQMKPSDAPLIQARDAVAKYDDGIAHTKAMALALLDRVIGETTP